MKCIYRSKKINSSGCSVECYEISHEKIMRKTFSPKKAMARTKFTQHSVASTSFYELNAVVCSYIGQVRAMTFVQWENVSYSKHAPYVYHSHCANVLSRALHRISKTNEWQCASQTHMAHSSTKLLNMGVKGFFFYLRESMYVLPQNILHLTQAAVVRMIGFGCHEIRYCFQSHLRCRQTALEC